MKIKDVLKNERPRERLKRHGCSTLASSELLAILLRSGSQKENVLVMSSKLLANYNLDVLSNLSVPELTKIHGIGEAKACQIVSCFELGRRLMCFSDDDRKQILCAKDVSDLFLPKMSHLKQEQFRVIYLDSRKRIIKDEIVFVGSLDSSVVHAREIFEPAITNSAAAVIFVHNHPSGDPSPSAEDISVTKQLVESGKILGIEILDHIIIGRNSFCSLKDHLNF